MSISLTSYQQTIRQLSDRLVEAQKPIRLLDALKWDNEIKEFFFKHNFTALPPVDRDYYERRPPAFDITQKRDEFYEIERDIRRYLGQFNAVGNLMLRMCGEYRKVIDAIEFRGTPHFTRISQDLFGSADDVFYAGDLSLNDLADMISDTLNNLDGRQVMTELDEKNISSETAVEILQARLDKYFHDSEIPIVVKLSDGIIADAAAGADYIKIRSDAWFSQRDLDLLEVHEGWVHLGTTLNGLNQPICTFLSKGPPSSTITQEGLAIIMEIFTMTSHPERVKRLTNRIHGIRMVENGANFLEVFQHFQTEGLNEEESYTATARVFRGSTPEGGAFTKDLCYNKGFILIYNYIMLSVSQGQPQNIPLLFCGKTTLKDISILAALIDEGLVIPPKFVPPQFSDLAALSAWMCYSNFLNRLKLDRIEIDYKGILSP
jgi:uncharacterized protein (TIGR02421 family)